jgi:cell division protease FtsH
LAEGRNYSEAVAAKIDSEVSSIVNRAYSRARQLLLDNKEKLVGVAKALLDKETLDPLEFRNVMTASAA